MNKYNVMPCGGIGYGITGGGGTVAVYEDEKEAYLNCRILNLQTELDRVIAERDRAINYIKESQMGLCEFCTHRIMGGVCEIGSVDNCHWEWRGLEAGE